MFGNFFTKLGEKMHEQAADGQSNANSGGNDIFSMLAQQSEAQRNSKSPTKPDDPLQYFLSPDPKSTAMPHVSKQKPAMTATNTQEQQSSQNQMQAINLFTQDQQEQPIQTAWEEEPSLESSEEEEEQTVEQMPPAPAPNARKRDYLSNFMQTAGSLIKQGATKASNKLTAEDEEKVISVLTKENEKLKEILSEQQEKVEDLQDEIVVHQSLEEEAHEQNEELIYKVTYLEELARDNGNDLTHLKKVEQVTQEKKSLQQQVDSLERQLTCLEKMKFSKDAQESDDTEYEQMFQNPKRALYDLKSLFEHNKISFCRSDENRVLTALYTQQKPVVRLYRELLYRKIAQKAVQSAESLFKQTNSLDRNGNEMCKLSLENKRLLAQNEALKKQRKVQESTIDQLKDDMMHQKARSAHKLGLVQTKAKHLTNRMTEVKDSMRVLQATALSQQQSEEDQEVLNMNVQRFSSYLNYFTEQEREKANKQREAQMEKYKKLLGEKTDAQKQLHQVRLQYSDVSSKLEQAKSDKTNIQEELGEAHESISHLELEVNQQFEGFEKERVERSLQEAQHSREIQALQQAIEHERNQRLQQETQLRLEIEGFKSRETLLQQEVQNLQQIPQGSPSSGGQPQPLPQVEASAENSEEMARQTQHISELEKMLEEREEEIIELMSEVNKLQEKEQQSPEVVQFLQILKSKLTNSQQKFQDQQHAGSSQERPALKQASPAARTQEQKTTQHVPILIEDQAPIGTPSDTSPRPNKSHYLQEDLPRNQQTVDSFNSNVREKLEDVINQRMEQSPQQTAEFYSRIVKDGKDSNFFSSMVHESSTERLEPVTTKVNDLFGFLMDPVSQVKEQSLNSINTIDNWGEAFGITPASTTNQQIPETAQPHAEQSPKKCEIKKTAGWGDAEEDELNLEEEPPEQNQRPSYNGNNQGDGQIQIALDLSHESQRGEIMFQESLENSPIKQNRTLEGMDSAKDIFANQVQTQNQALAQDNQPSLIQKTLQPTEVTDTQSPTKENLSDQKNDQASQSGPGSHHKRTKRISQNPKEAFLDGSLEYLGHDIPVTTQFESKQEDSRGVENQDQNESYLAAINSLAEQEEQQKQNSKDMDAEVYKQLMYEQDEEEKSESASDSLLHTSESPWNNSFTRQEAEMVVTTIRKQSLLSQENSQDYSPLLSEEKRVNVSNLSDLIPEDPIPEKINENEDEQCFRALKIGAELNEIHEEDEDISDDLSSRQQKSLPTSIHERADSNTILDMQMSSKTRKISQEYIHLKNSEKVNHVSTPSMTEEMKFESLIEEKHSDKDCRGSSVVKCREVFSKKIAFVLGVPKAQDLEPIDLIEDSLNQVKESLTEWAGDFDQTTVVCDESQMPRWSTTEFAKIEQLSAENCDQNILVALYFKGHSSLTDGCVSYLGEQENEQTKGLETFLRKCGTLQNVYPLGIFDCCRLDTEESGPVTIPESVHNILCVYRDQNSQRQLGSSCETVLTGEFFGKKFLSHLKQFEESRSSENLSLLPRDLRSFCEKSKILLKGWKESEEVSFEKQVIEREPKNLSARNLLLQVPLYGEEEPVKQAISARAQHRRNESIGKNPFHVAQTEQESNPTAESAQSSETPKQQQFDNLAEFTKENLIQYQEDGKTVEQNEVDETADFEDSKDARSETQDELGESKDEFKSAEASGYFTRDFRVIRFATYGNDDGSQRIQRKLDMEYGIINESQDMGLQHEQNIQSFAEPPPSEVELSACSIDVNELQGDGNFQMMQMMQNSMTDSRGSFENNFRASFEKTQHLDAAKLNSFCGSLVNPNNGSIVETLAQNLNVENSIEEYEEDSNGIPDVAVYNEDSLEHQGLSSYAENGMQEDACEEQLEPRSAQKYDEDSQSLESVQENKSAQISSQKQHVDPVQNLQDLQMAERAQEKIVQSNHQDDQSKPKNDGNMAAGWEDDESLEEIDKLGDEALGEYEASEELNRSISANEQVSDAVIMAEQENEIEKTEPLAELTSEELILQNEGEIFGQGLSRNSEQRRNTPIPNMEEPRNVVREEKLIVQGWADVSDEISLSEDQSMTNAVQEQSLATLKANLENPLSTEEMDLSQTTIAEIGESNKFKCPNGHKLTIIDGKMHPLPEQECSAFCGMANQQNSKNWLRCRECYYKVCHECFHCTEGHEKSIAKSEDFANDQAFGELTCESCGSEIQGKLWVCEVIAFAQTKTPESPLCSDKSLICQECLGSGNSLAMSRNQISKDDSYIFASPQKNLQGDDSKENGNQIGESAQNEQTCPVTPPAAEKGKVTDLDDIFGMALNQQNQALDPFKAFLTAQPEEERKGSTFEQPTAMTGNAEEEKGETIVGGTGGGWGDADDDIDID